MREVDVREVDVRKRVMRRNLLLLCAHNIPYAKLADMVRRGMLNRERLGMPGDQVIRENPRQAAGHRKINRMRVINYQPSYRRIVSTPEG